MFKLGLGVGAFLEVKLGDRVKNLACAWTSAVVFFDIANFGIFADMEGMNAIMDGVFWAAVIDAAAGDDSDVGVVADIEIIYDNLFVAGF